MKITLNKIEKLTAITNPVYLWDSSLPGFGVKALKSGRKNYIVKYRVGGGRSAKQRWLKLGDCNVLKLPKAREQAQQALAAAARGDDPQAHKQDKSKYKTLNDVWLRFEEEVLPSRKASTVSDYRSMWKINIQPKLGKRDLKKITRDDLTKLHLKLKSTPYRANRVLSVCSRLFNLCEAWGWRDQGTNPCKYVEKFPETSRERYLNKAEIKSLNQAMVSLIKDNQLNPQIRRVFLLLLLTGARKNEILSCEWEWVDIDRSVILLPDSKTGKKTLYLGKQAKALLKEQAYYSSSSKWVFPSSKNDIHIVNVTKAWRKIRILAGLQDLRIHDLRHAAASIAVNEGVALPIIGKVLGHSQSRTTERYAHLQDKSVLEAVNVLNDEVEDAIFN